MPEPTIFDYITKQESLYKMPVPLNEKWSWGMREHILQTILYTNSQLYNGKDEYTPVKNITRPLLNLQHRAEDLEVKDVELYVDDPGKYHLSFLVRKYHDDVFAKEYDLDSFIDELNVSRIDYGAGLSKQLNHPCPEVVRLETIAFCDQTDLLSGPIGIEHYYSPDQLLDMEQFGWGDPKNGATISIKELIALSRDEKRDIKNSNMIRTPGRYIKVYEVHGNLPKKYANPSDDSEEYETRLFIVAFYQKKDATSPDDRAGVILYTAPETKSPFKLIKREGKADVYGRALGFGGAEEIFEDQIWTNYAAIRKQGLLDASSKVILQTDDPTVTQKQKVRDLENLSVIDVAPNTSIRQIDTVPRSMQLFNEAIAEWETHAKDMAAAQDPIQGKAGGHGDPFAAIQSQLIQSQGLHDYRRGIFAKHIEEIYKDWIIPYIQKEIVKGKKFLSELSLDELQMVSQALITNQTNQWVKDQVLNGNIPTQDVIDAYKQQATIEFSKKGRRHFIEILKGEFKDTDLGVKVSVASKSKDLSGHAKDIVSVLTLVRDNLYMLQVPPIAELVNQAIEAIGMNPVDFSQIKVSMPPPQRQERITIGYKDVAAVDPQAASQMLNDAGIQSGQPTPSPMAAPSAGQPTPTL